MDELKKITLERAVTTQVKKMMAKWELRRAQQIRAASLGDEITQLRRARSLWPSIMSELTSKFSHKKKDCEKVLVKEEEEEDWTSECNSNALMQEAEGWVTDDDDDDNDDGGATAAPAPIQRPPLQMRRRRGRRGEPLYIRF